MHASTMVLLPCLVVLILLPALGLGADSVRIRSRTYYGLETSDTLQWTKPAEAKEPVKTPDDLLTVCRLVEEPKDVGSVHDGFCHVIDPNGDGTKPAASYQVISGFAGKLVWEQWKRAAKPAPGAVTYADNMVDRYIAYDKKTGSVGYLDTRQNYGTCVFPGKDDETSHQMQCQVLREIVPERYELFDVELKKKKNDFREETIELAQGDLHNRGEESSSAEPWFEQQMDVEKIFAYEYNELDSWGTAELMKRGLHTVIKLPEQEGRWGNSKTIEWGLPMAKGNQDGIVIARERLARGTGVNVTILGTRLSGFMQYWAKLKTIYADQTFKIRNIEGHRKVDRVENAHAEKGRIYYLQDGSLVPLPSTTTTTSTTSTTTVAPPAAPSTTIVSRLPAEEPTSVADATSPTTEKPLAALTSSVNSGVISSLNFSFAVPILVTLSVLLRLM